MAFHHIPRISKEDVPYDHDYQFYDYQTLPYMKLAPFISLYFTPSDEIMGILNSIENEINLRLQYNHLCTVFFRGNDKVKETDIGDPQAFLTKATEIALKIPTIKFLIQSDDTNFLTLFEETFPGKCIILYQWIRHVPTAPMLSVDHFHREQSLQYVKNYLAITVIMSKCKYIVCNSGNCSVWIMYYRGNADNICQYLEGSWISSISFS
jgi:hypothetical protein